MNFQGPEQPRADSPESPLSIQDALGAIKEKEGIIWAMGGNNFEIPEINEIRVELQNGKCSPADAVRKVQDILERKQAPY